MSEGLIAQVKPKAYQEAGKYQRKAAKVMAKARKQKEWERYLQSLRDHHARKIRLMEVLDSLDYKPIIKKSFTHIDHGHTFDQFGETLLDFFASS
jgi:hypothetical protein